MILGLLLLVADLPADPPVRLAQLGITVRQRTVIRVPFPGPAEEGAFRWRERKGPRCVALVSIAGAQIAGEDSVDMIFRGGFRVRARLERACPALAFYGGFYLRPGRDGRVCAGRDAIHARSGGACQIERFRALAAERRR